LRRTACVSYVALEACEVAVRTSWNPQEGSTYHELLHREERRLDEAFGGMMPDELPGAVVAVAEVWLDDAYDNITLAQTCLAARKQQEEGQAALDQHPEPPDGETSAEEVRTLWIPRALQQTSYVSHMAQEIEDSSTKAGWDIWSYKHYRGLLDKEMMEACRTYAEVELADLPVSEGKEAKGWLTSAHQKVEHAQEHIGERIEKMRVSQALLYPAPEGASLRCHRRRTRGRVLREARRAGPRPRDQAEEAAARARLQAARRLVYGPEETGSGQPRDSTCPRTPGGSEVELVDSTSESDTSAPGGNAAAFQRSCRLERLPVKVVAQAAARARQRGGRAGCRRATSSRDQGRGSGTQTVAGGRDRIQLDGDGR